jgi:hypothetical protein
MGDPLQDGAAMGDPLQGKDAMGTPAGRIGSGGSSPGEGTAAAAGMAERAVPSGKRDETVGAAVPRMVVGRLEPGSRPRGWGRWR